MAFPVGWPPRVSSGLRSIRFFTSGLATAAFADNAFLFSDGAGANPYTPFPVVAPGSNAPVAIPVVPTGTGVQASAVDAATKPMIWSSSLRIRNDGGAVLEFSFDGTNIHGSLKAGEEATYYSRIESGIAVRGAGAAFRIEAW